MSETPLAAGAVAGAEVAGAAPGDLAGGNRLATRLSATGASPPQLYELLSTDEKVIWDEAHQMFSKIDVDGSGVLDMDEVQKLGVMLGFNFSHVELVTAMKQMDEDGSGQVEFVEFYEWWVEKKEQEGNLDMHNEAVNMFNRVDVDGSGVLDQVEVAQLAGLLGFNFSEIELVHTMQAMDTDGDGEVNFEEFWSWWQERNRRGDLRIHNNAVKMFREVDQDNSGSLDAGEIKELGFLLGFEFTPRELEEAMLQMSSGNDTVDFVGFYPWWVSRIQRGDTDLHNEALSVFRGVDVDNSGRLDKAEVGRLGQLLDFHFSPSELEEAMKQMDLDNSGEVEFEEFYEW